MAKLINIGFGNVVNSQKIVAVVNPDAAPVKRMVPSVKGSNSLVDATQGRKTKSVIVILRPHSDIICDPAGHDRSQICRSYRK